MIWWAVLAAAAGAGVVAAAVWALVIRSPEPDPHDPDKIPYAQLRTVRNGVTVVILAVVTATLVAGVVPVHAAPAMLVLAGVGVPLAVCDAITTWIPARLCHLAWGVMAAAVVVALGIPGGGPQVLAVAVAVCAATTALFALGWRAGQCGFGDVRFVVLIGAATGLQGLLPAAVAIAAGCLVAAGHVTYLRRRRSSGLYPWTPGLLSGAVGASLVMGVVGG